MYTIYRIFLLVTFAINSVWSYKFIGPKWPGANPVVQYWINEQGSPEVLDEVDHIVKSFKVWDQVPTSTLETKYLGMTAANSCAKDNINLLKWAKGRDWTLGQGVIAAAYIWYKSDVIQEFDILFNDQHFSWSTSGEANKMDVGHIATHEVGHVLGLDHSSVSGAVMWPTARPGDLSNRKLHSDDSAGLSALYPRTDNNNRAPVITSKPVTEAVAGMKYAYSVTANDPDGDPVTFKLEKYPLNMRIDEKSGQITWFPKFLDVGSHTVTVVALDNSSKTSKQTFQVAVTNLRVYTENREIRLGDTLFHEVKVSPMDEFGIFSGNIELDFNNSQMSVLGVDTKGSVVDGASFFKNITDRQVKIAFAGSDSFIGEGILFRVKLLVHEGSCGEVIRMGIGKALFNDGEPAATVQNGDIFMSCQGGDGWSGGYTMDGRVTYLGNGEGVSKVKLDFPKMGKTTTTQDDGFFAFKNVPLLKMDFSIIASKDSGDIRNAISAYDASLVLRHVVGLHSLKDFENQKYAADVNGNGVVTAYDAALILRHLVNLKDITHIGWWVVSPDKRNFNGILGDMHNINFGAYLVGDVSGNWKQDLPVLAKRTAENDNKVFLSEYRQQDVSLPLGAIDGYRSVISLAQEMEGMYSGEFELAYDSDKYEFLDARSLPMTKGYLLESNAVGDNIRVVFAGTEPLPGSGELFEVLLAPKSKLGTPPPLNSDLAYFKVNEGLFQSVGIMQHDSKNAARFAGKRQFRVQPRTGGHLEMEYFAETPSEVSFSLLDVKGRMVKRMSQGHKHSGSHRLTWEIDNRGNSARSNQIYFVAISMGSRSETVKVLLVE